MIYVVIPVHNRKQYTRTCLQCLRGQTHPSVQTIIVDDGSTDGTDAMVQAEFPEAVLLKGDGNLWWTEATNVGIRYAFHKVPADEENFILTLNDDTEVGPDYVAQLLATYREHGPCLVGSVSVDSANPARLEYAGTRVNLRWTGEVDLASQQYQNQYSRLKHGPTALRSDSLPGRGVLIPFRVLHEIGLFDSRRFTHYMADIEFSVRAHKAGFPLMVSVLAVVREHVHATGLDVKGTLSLGQFVRGMFSMRSATYLKPRFYFALRHSPTHLLYFLLDVARMFTGYTVRRYKARTLKAGV